jgi:hypothetical protein
MIVMNKSLLITLAIVATIAIPAFAAAPAKASSSCWLKHSTHHRSFGRVKMMQRTTKRDAFHAIDGSFVATYVCSTRFGKQVQLPVDEFPTEDSYAVLASTSRFLIYTVVWSCAACDDPGSENWMVDLKTGKRHLFHPDLTGNDVFANYFAGDPLENVNHEYFDPVVIRPNGSVAYGTTLNSYNRLTDLQKPTLCGIATSRFDGHEYQPAVVLDQLASCDDEKTLKLNGTKLTWSNAGVAKSGTID